MHRYRKILKKSKPRESERKTYTDHDLDPDLLIDFLDPNLPFMRCCAGSVAQPRTAGVAYHRGCWMEYPHVNAVRCMTRALHAACYYLFERRVRTQGDS